jgi:hypothetical protein
MARLLRIGLALLGIVAAGSPAASQPAASAPPSGLSTCPAEYPVKIYASKHSDAPGVYYAPGSTSYDRVKPERCFASESAARQAGYRAGTEERAPAQGDGRTRRTKP